MSVTSVTEIWKGEGATLSADQRSYVRMFQVLTDNPQDNAAVVLTTGALPKEGDLYPWDQEAAVVDMDYSRSSESRTVHMVSVTYETPTSNQQKKQNQEPDPTNRQAEVTSSVVKIEKEMTEDVDGKAILNTAGVAFDPPIIAQRSQLRLVVSQAEPALYSGEELLDLVNHTNESAFQGGAKDTVLLESIEQQTRTEKEFIFAQKTYTFLFDPNGWQAKPLNQGMQELDGDGNLVRIKVFGEDVTEPLPLDAAGIHIIPALLPDEAIFGDKDGNPFQIYKRLDFNTIPLRI